MTELYQMISTIHYKHYVQVQAGDLLGSLSARENDGKRPFIDDKPNSRIGRIDLDVYETEEIERVPKLRALHGIAVVSPDTKYVIGDGEFGAEVWGYPSMTVRKRACMESIIHL